MSEENILGIKPIPQLALRFGIPSIISMLVNSIYNLVDQIFIGQKVGYLGNAATSVTFPFVTISLAVSLMISVGTAANVGLNLGGGDHEKADRTLGCGFLMAVLSGLILFGLGEALLIPCLRLFGATDLVMPYAIDYARWYLIGVPLVAVGILTSDEIRADGSPSYAMITMLVGAVTNIFFDWLFVFDFEWGVVGAAVATVMGQFLTMVLNLLYFRRLKTLHFLWKYVRLDPVILLKILTLGFSSFINQAVMLIVQIIVNKQAVTYGALSKYGSEIPLTVFGIILKVNALMVSIIMGMTNGSQPIFSFNYGAGHYRRVKELIRTDLIVCTIIGLCGTAVFQNFPSQIIGLFGQEDALYNEFAVMALKTMTMLIFILSIQQTASVYFQAVGKPKKAMIISLSRQLIFMVPALYILPHFIGVKGIMASYPCADACAVVLCAVLLLLEMRTLNRLLEKENNG